MGALTAEALRGMRNAAGITQRQLSDRSGVPQPNIAAYERGRRAPSDATADRLIDALRFIDLDRLRAMRPAIEAAARARDLTDVRVFGSVARGETTADSDLDLLVHPGGRASVVDLAAFMLDVEELLRVTVDVVSDRGTGPTLDRIRRGAVPL